ncbi:MAG: type I-C CRISPR-associated protein Cas7/Csd2 [Deltaproteobacteria bacterium]|nr:type I-C CRISPR-associated protein Cas7/Csd2 [Deltaproteobacteria bacterium]
MSSHTDPQKRHDFVYLFDVVNGNPNGDPDSGNQPRFDPDTLHGLVTDVCLKRKVRDYVALIKEEPIFIQSQVALNRLIVEGYNSANIKLTQLPVKDADIIAWFQEVQPDGFDWDEADEAFTLTYDGSQGTSAKDIQNALIEVLSDDQKHLEKALKELSSQIAKSARKPSPEERGQARSKLMEKFYDIRMFGAVLSTGLNAGQVRGPMQLSFARSISQIFPRDISITRVAVTREADRKRKETEMARKALVHYGLYRTNGFFSPYLADKEKNGTGVTKNDLEIFWEALLNMFNYDRSAARGEMACRGLYIFSHDNPKGNASAHKLFEMIKVSEKNYETPPRQFLDYQVTLPEGVTLAEGATLSENVTLLPDLRLPPGVTLTVLEG